MGGFITKTEVVENAEYIIETWGREFFEVCLESEGKTFLGLLAEFGGI